MAEFNLTLKEPPPGVTGWQARGRDDNSLLKLGPKIPFTVIPSVMSKLHELRGWYDGLGYCPVCGHVQAGFDGSNVTLTGELEYFDPRLTPVIEQIINLTYLTLNGIGKTFPGTQLTIRYRYEIQWPERQ